MFNNLGIQHKQLFPFDSFKFKTKFVVYLQFLATKNIENYGICGNIKKYIW